MQNQLDLSYLNITQLLELQTPAAFEVVVPQIAVDTNSVISGNITEIFALAETTRPEIKSSEYNLTASEYAFKTAKGGRSPRLSMNYSYNTAYVSTALNVLGYDATTLQPIYGGTIPLSKQISDNKNY